MAHWRAELKPWQRFPLRLMAFYGGAAVLLLSSLAAWSYRQQLDAEMYGLQRSLSTLSAAMALHVDGDMVFALEGPEARAYWKGLEPTFEALAEAEPDADDLYLMRTTTVPGVFEHLVDVMPHSDNPGKFLDRYDASDVPVMMDALNGPRVEEELYWDRFGWSISGYAPVRDSAGRTVAIAGVDVVAKRVYTMRRRALISTLAALLIALTLLGGISVAVGRQIIGPLGRVIDASDAIARGNLDIRVATERVDEFGLLGRYFDEMAEGLRDREFLRTTFGRYMSERVAEAVLDDHQVDLGGEMRDVTVLFSDLRGYSTLTEHAAPTEVVRLLNEYFGEMNEIIEAHQGDVIEFLGDGILAVFGAPLAVEAHAVKAVSAAVAMRARLDVLNDEWEASGRAQLWKDCGIDSLVTRFGIHSGRVIAGNLGSTKRMKYAVIGDNVNVAARLEQLNKKLDSTIAISGEVHSRLPEGRFDVTSRGDVKVKGREDPVPVFTL